MLRISPIIALAILPNMEPWSSLCHSHVDDARFICNRLNSVSVASFVQCDSTSVSVERELLIIKAVVIQRIGRPKIRGLAVRIEYLGIELASSANATVEKKVNQPLLNLVVRL